MRRVLLVLAMLAMLLAIGSSLPAHAVEADSVGCHAYLVINNSSGRAIITVCVGHSGHQYYPVVYATCQLPGETRTQQCNVDPTSMQMFYNATQMSDIALGGYVGIGKPGTAGCCAVWRALAKDRDPCTSAAIHTTTAGVWKFRFFIDQAHLFSTNGAALNSDPVGGNTNC